jgi:hypothetical protein
MDSPAVAHSDGSVTLQRMFQPQRLRIRRLFYVLTIARNPSQLNSKAKPL